MIDSAELLAIFEKEYNRTDWLHALREIFQISNLHEVPQEVDLPANDFDARALEMGFFETSEGLLVGIFEVTITPNIPLERHKVGLRNMMRKVYQRDMDAALIVFTQGNSWRFSYASELTVVNKETRKREKRQTDPKRFTYLLGTGQHCRTAAERFAKLKSTTDLFDTKVSISEIEKAFSVDTLTKDFYRELSSWYFYAISKVTFPDDDEPNDEARNPSNLIRLITRLIFVWFLKQKGLVPDSLFDKEKIWPHLNFDFQSNSTYYKAILQNLFFATLNQEMNKRAFRKIGQHYNITNLYRYRNLFKKPDETIELFKNIPFLNGGLFECLDKPHPTEKTSRGSEKIVRIDGFSDHDDNPLHVPDYLFFGGAKAVDLSVVLDDVRQRNVDIRGIIEILNSYNFTVEENTPLEIQVALDPELLGKVFENLLASYNPETKTTARKQTGSFYTPREIVNYMVDESLIAYLKQKLVIEYSSSEEETENKLRQLVSYSGNGNPFDEPETQVIVEAIDNIKVLDPACGSGAFPMGILQQLVHVLQKLDPDNRKWKQLQMQRAQEEIQEAIAAGDSANFVERLKEIADAFENNAEDYGRKLYLIENCIYGVDIQPIAVQIAKLRFFISLLVDQTINPEVDNLGIRALPNLETKFVAANSLIPINRQGLVLRTNEVIEKEKALKQIRHKYFIARTPEQKRKMRVADEKLREEIAQIIYNEALAVIETNHAMLERKLIEYQNSSRVIESLKLPAEVKKYKKNLTKLAAEIEKLKASILNPDVVDQTAKMLAGWNPYEQNRYAAFFDSEWMFGIKDGFDVVIGNPPYIQMQKEQGKLAKQFENIGFETFERTGDIYSLFYEKGIQLLKTRGHLTYITSNKWMRAGYGKSTRFYFCQHNPLKLIDLGSGVFETATVDTNILLIQKTTQRNNAFKLYALDIAKEKHISSFDAFSNRWVMLTKLSEDSWTISSEPEQRIKAKIERLGKPLKDWDISIYRGVLTGYNEAFIIDGKKKDELIAQDTRSAEIIKPILRGKDIKRYQAQFADLWLIGTFPALKININDYPAVKSYLKSFGKRLHQTGEEFIDENGQKAKSRKKTGNKWFETQDQIGYYKDFEKEKIVWKRIGSIIRFQYDDIKSLCLDSTCFLTGQNIKFLLAYLNSKIAINQLIENSPKTGTGDVITSVQAVEPILVPNIAVSQQKPFVELVEKILIGKSLGQDTTALEQQIDNLVFKLYNLTYDEVKIIDPEFALSEEEYNNIKLEE